MTGALATTHLLAYAGAPSAAVQLRILLTGFQTGPLALLADALEVALALVYLAGVRRLRSKGRRWPVARSAAFLGGVAVMWIAVGSGFAAYDNVNVQLHVIQHVLLMMVAAPLVSLGRPITLASQALDRRGQLRLVAIVHSKALSVLTFPVVAWFLYYGVMYGYFMDRAVYDYSIAHRLFHDATHLVFFVVGYLYWQPIIGGDATRWRLSHPVRLGSLFLGMPFEAFLGIAISTMPQPLDPVNSIANTRSAGQMFWILAMMFSGFWVGSVVFQWFRQLERSTPREDRVADRTAEDARARAEALGIDNLPPGATVPWWRLEELERKAAAAEEASRAPGEGTPVFGAPNGSRPHPT